MPNPDPQVEDDAWLPVWDHSSSRDLIHWIHHPPAIVPAFDGTTPRGLYSGDAIEDAQTPMLIYHVPGQGTCIATCQDNDLDHWTPSPHNPVIPIPEEPQEQEYVVFDPCAWREGDAFYALIGNKNRRPSFEGDCTSLFRSMDLHHWEYLHPFYKSDRRWTDAVEDCACPDSFPLGNSHMLLMHGHRPYGQVHYYLGRYENERFYPEIHGRMNWPGGQLCAPETLLDDQGRRVFFGWIREARPWEEHGWASVMSLPRLLSLGEDGTLRIEPAPELEALRHNPRRRESIELSPDAEVELVGIRGDCLEIRLTMEPGDAQEFGVKVRCSPNSEEETAIVCQPQAGMLKVELDKSTLDESVDYAGVRAQEAPFQLERGEALELRIFLDRSVSEVFANSRQCVTQRIYPTRSDSLAVLLFARVGSASVRLLEAWDGSATNSW